ncbi:hypothetical protein KBZ94_41625 [Streptomyces sp. RM72]|uniref:hypothetical protein n=1 Tax=Streptomyces sp. RM72 TaxID=1115510 RepID=UPI001B38B4E5|nr:hypothetical protein [Streptomyces sp. RM72]MBQ0891334.1 hypothetical protein [Streptomyces sp. RM72]
MAHVAGGYTPATEYTPKPPADETTAHAGGTPVGAPPAVVPGPDHGPDHGCRYSDHRPDHGRSAP